MQRADHLLTRRLSTALALGALLLATACEPEPTIREDRAVTARTQDIPALVDGNNAFAVDIYQQVTAGEDGNVFLSPFSISSALAMTYAGARTTTAEAMQDTLHITLDDASYHAAFGALTRDLDGEFAGRAYQLNIANRLFGQTGYEFGAEFLAINADDYGAPMQDLDFYADPEGSRETINEWVADQTVDKIPELLKAGIITSDTRLVLTNAIYFKAFWATQFDPDETYDGTFRTPSGNVTVPLMNMETEVEYAY
ncbi:MAG: serpin family protein, partial [Deltaproteobacteria bacterium]|nr:serpin family protein [Deltaproteobacteria bacterium]